MQLIWFRQDLRLHDNTALWHAAQAGDCIALVILSPQQWALHDDASVKIDFYLRQIEALKKDLAALHIPLIIRHVPLWSDIADDILTLCQTLDIQSVHANIETGINELQRDQAVEHALAEENIAFEPYHDRTLFPLEGIRNKSGKPYQVFGAFKKVCYEKLSTSLPSCYPSIEAQAITKVQAVCQTLSCALQAFYPDNIPSEIRSLWQVGEDHALEILDDFIRDQVEHYQCERDFPRLHATSQIGAYLNIGILSIRQCVQALFRAQQGYLHIDHVGQQTWFDELLWREFYQHILHDFPQVSKHQPFKSNTKALVWRNAPEDLAAWQQGQTGIPIVDAGMRQLQHTGWMHNRVRMITAMFLSKNLLIDWRLGEAWFMQHLIDGDLAANNGGWQWCASTGTDASPYFRIFNPVSQSQKFDAQGEYIRRWLPELAHLDDKSIHAPYEKHPDLVLNYPKPIVDLKSSRIRAIDAFRQLESAS